MPNSNFSGLISKLPFDPLPKILNSFVKILLSKSFFSFWEFGSKIPIFSTWGLYTRSAVIVTCAEISSVLFGIIEKLIFFTKFVSISKLFSSTSINPLTILSIFIFTKILIGLRFFIFTVFFVFIPT